MPATTRFDHSNCDHPTAGAEGKKARAKCRKEHAEGNVKTSKAKAPVKTARAAAKTPRATAAKPSPRKAKVPVSTVPSKDDAAESDLDVSDL